MNTETDDHVVDNQIDPDSILVYTHKTRKKIVQALMKEGKVPEDIKDLNVLTTVLSDMDRSALTNKKIKSEEKISNNNASIIASFLNNIQPIDYEKENKNITPPTLDGVTDLPVISESEKSTGISTTTYEDFASIHFKPNNPLV